MKTVMLFLMLVACVLTCGCGFKINQDGWDKCTKMCEKNGGIRGCWYEPITGIAVDCKNGAFVRAQEFKEK